MNLFNEEINNIKGEKQSEKEIQNIYLKFNQYLTFIDGGTPSIFDTSKFICDIYYKNKNLFFQELLPLITFHSQTTKKLEYLYLIIEIIKYLCKNNNVSNKIPENDKISLYLCMKDICRSFHYSMNNEFIKAIKDTLNKFKEENIFSEIYINSIIMELRIKTEPKITSSENDKKSLFDLNKGKFLNIDIDMINFYKDLEAVDKRNVNKLKVNLIKKENSIIEKQINLYNHNLEQIKTINELLGIIDKNFPSLK